MGGFSRRRRKLHVQTSSILGAAEQLRNKTAFRDQLGWTYCLFGNQAHAGDFHHVGFTEATLKAHLLAVGFEIDSFELKDAWLFHVDCHKVYSWTQVLAVTSEADDDEFIRAIYAQAFEREPDPAGHRFLAQSLKRKKMSRRDALKHLMQSRERLHFTAAKHGL